jgi:hypothetical protein
MCREIFLINGKVREKHKKSPSDNFLFKPVKPGIFKNLSYLKFFCDTISNENLHFFLSATTIQQCPDLITFTCRIEITLRFCKKWCHYFGELFLNWPGKHIPTHPGLS